MKVLTFILSRNSSYIVIIELSKPKVAMHLLIYILGRQCCLIKLMTSDVS